MKKYLAALMLLFVCTTNWAQFGFEHYVLTGLNLVDVVESRVVKDQAIWISHGKIVKLSPSEGIKIPDSVQEIKLQGKYILPGLIDTHVHMATDASDENENEAEVILEKMLRSGITSVRDMAGDARRLSNISRNALVGDILSPNLYFSALLAGPDFFTDPRTIATAKGGKSGEMPYMRAVTKDSPLESVLNQAKGTGATGLKLYAELGPELTKSITALAHEMDLMVWAHVDLDQSKPSQVVTAGVDVLSHGHMFYYEKYEDLKMLPTTWLKPDSSKFNKADYWLEQVEALDLLPIFDQMASQGTILDATLTVSKLIAEEVPSRSWMLKLNRAVVQKAKERGVLICAGTDSDQNIFVQEEIKMFVKDCGFSPLEALRSGTVNGAKAIGIDAHTGSIEEGKWADLLVLEKDPTLNIEALDQAFLVIKRGRFYNPNGEH